MIPKDSSCNELFKSCTERAKQDFPFIEVSQQDRLNIINSASQPDIDSFFYVTDFNNMFVAEPMSSYLRFFQVVQTFKYAKLNKISSFSYDGMYTIAKINNFSIGIPILKGSLKRSTEFVDEEDELSLRHINSLISHFEDKCTIPYDIFIDQARFINEKQIAIFNCGQKFNLSSFSLDFFQLSNNGVLEIAIATEFSSIGKFICASYESNLSGTFYSNFLSNKASNFLQTEKSIRNASSNGIFRTCIYNTFYHKKKFLKKKMNFKNIQFDSELDTIHYFQTMILSYLNDFQKMLPSLANSKLRQEFYLVYSKPQEYETSISMTKKLLDDLKIVSLDENELISKVNQKFVDFSVFLDDASMSTNEFIEVLMIVLFFKCYTSIFSTTPITKKLLMTNYGIGVSTSCVNADLKLNERFFKEYIFSDFRYIVDSLLERNSFNAAIYYYLLLQYIFGELNVVGEFNQEAYVIETLADFIRFFSVKKSNLKNVQKEVPMKFQEFLVFISSKMERNGNPFKSKSWKIMLKLLEKNSIFDRLEKFSKIHRINFYNEKILYYITDKDEILVNVSKSEINCTISGIVKFIKTYKQYFLKNCSTKDLPPNFNSSHFSQFINYLMTAYKEYTENVKIGRFYEFRVTGDLDYDFFLRLLFAHVPLDIGMENIPYLCIPEFFQDSNWLFKFITFAEIIYNNFGTKYAQDLFLKNISYALGKHIKLIRNVSPRELLYYTGCFISQTMSTESIDGVESVPFNYFPRIYFTRSNAENARLNFFALLSSTNVTSNRVPTSSNARNTSFVIGDLLVKRRKILDAMGMADDSNTEILEGAHTVATDTNNIQNILRRTNDDDSVNSNNDPFGGIDFEMYQFSNPTQNELSTSSVTVEASISNTLLNNASVEASSMTNLLELHEALSNDSNSTVSSGLQNEVIAERISNANWLEQIVDASRPLRKYKEDILSLAFEKEDFEEVHRSKKVKALKQLLEIEEDTADLIFTIIQRKRE